MKIIVIALIIFSFLHSADIQNRDLEAENKKLIEKIAELQKLILKQQKILKIKQNIDKNLFNNGSECGDEDTFPKLMMKKEYQEEVQDEDEIIKFSSISFRLREDSAIYDSINGEKIGEWKSGRVFTSSMMNSHWIKISGYYENKKYKIAKKEMWVNASQISKR